MFRVFEVYTFISRFLKICILMAVVFELQVTYTSAELAVSVPVLR